MIRQINDAGNLSVSINIYMCYFCPKHNESYMDEKEIVPTLQ